MDKGYLDAVGCIFWIVVAIAGGILLNIYEKQNTTHANVIGEIVDVRELAIGPLDNELVIKVEGEITRIKFSDDFYYLHMDEIETGNCLLLDKATYAFNSYTFKDFVTCP